MDSHWAEVYVNIGFDIGWFGFFGDSYEFVPDAPITRAQAVTLINHYTGRLANPFEINQRLFADIFIDITRGHWAFYEIMEAAIEHRYEIHDGIEVWLD